MQNSSSTTGDNLYRGYLERFYNSAERGATISCDVTVIMEIVQEVGSNLELHF